MRIVVDARVIGSELPGVARATLGLLQGLVELDHDSAVTLLHRPEQESRLAELGLHDDQRFELRPVAVPATGLRRQQRLRRLAAQIPHDTWHAPYVARPLRGTGPAAVVAYDLIVPDAGRPLTPRVARRRARWAATAALSLRSAAHVIVPSEATAAAVRRRLRVPASRVTIVPLAAGARFRPCDAGDVQRRHGVRSPYVMHLASNQPTKNTGALVRAWERMAADGATTVDGSRAQLVLAGHLDPSRPAPAEVYAAAPDVRCLGPVPDADLPPLLAGAAAFAFPSLEEGFGLPALEAMASGSAVVAANRASLPEVVGDAGLLVEPTVEGLAAGLTRLLRDAPLRDGLARAGRERARRFSWVRTAELTLGVHRDIAAGDSR